MNQFENYELWIIILRKFPFPDFQTSFINTPTNSCSMSDMELLDVGARLILSDSIFTRVRVRAFHQDIEIIIQSSSQTQVQDLSFT